MHVSSRKAFTLIELLVVIAIIAILAVVVVLTLNPAELLRQSRDSNRLSDLATVSNAINLYNIDQSGASSFSLGIASDTYPSTYDPTATSTAGDQCQGLGMPSLNASSGQAWQCSPSSTYRNINGTGWIPVNLSNISAGSPIGTLPMDPTNQTSSGFFYAYNTNGSQFEITAIPESTKYRAIQMTSQPISTIPGPFTQGSNLSLSSLFNPTGIVRYWKFNEGSGSLFYDYSGNSDTGNSWGATGWVAGSKLETSAMNVPSSISVNFSTTNSLPTTLVTVSAWVKVASFANWHQYLNENWANIGSWALFPDSSGNLNFGVVNGSSQQKDATGCSAGFTSGSWHFLVGTYDGSNVKAYLDGTLCNTTALSGQTLSTSATLTLNAAASGSYSMNDLKVYNRALSAGEIQAIYNAEK